ncbi:Uncharacterized protein MCB1EB_2022 [Mycoavidus cysteinexigens]|uniref:Uncharacterized protein n=1 Tax=Mycoavidus cysteinexigens TaxID=1553431 RepID=A0A2Z6EXJ5_9BURK|nr:hypothetical protein [Mycoavidus cysteinexigens]BBE10183.1 Uncharacterized protein MCB1EB_2022 [Mycoavidus cysteinexigens]GAM53459.1 hypothetical protein EBME_1922 [bacterium endosymbiont of Mortierella elongata FMR23-6]GLR00600.1 hypothetical protein GCM10007934_04110 [Mycoavidus cysteinexigens]
MKTTWLPTKGLASSSETKSSNPGKSSGILKNAKLTYKPDLKINSSSKKIQKTKNIGNMNFEFHNGTHGKKKAEQMRLKNKYHVLVSGKTHQSEHPIGCNVLLAGLPRYGTPRFKQEFSENGKWTQLAKQNNPLNWKADLEKLKETIRDIENFAPAYQEVLTAHNVDKTYLGFVYHIGTGMHGSETDQNPETSSRAYRECLTIYLHNNQPGEAIAFNQKLYANTTYYQYAVNAPSNGFTIPVQQANNSYLQMLTLTKTIPYLNEEGNVQIATLSTQGKLHAFEARAMMLKAGAYPNLEERKRFFKLVTYTSTSQEGIFSRKEAPTKAESTPIAVQTNGQAVLKKEHDDYLRMWNLGSGDN